MRFPELPQQTPVVLRIIRELRPEQYDELSKQSMVIKRIYEQGNQLEHEQSSLNQQKIGIDLQPGYDQYQGSLQDYRKSTKYPKLPPKLGNMPNKTHMDNGSSS